MRAAPAVRVIARRAGAWRAVQAALVGAAVLAFTLWVLAFAGVPSWPAVPLTALAAWIVWRLAAKSPVELGWDGQAWSADGRAGTLAVMLDLGGWMLLKLRPLEPPRAAVWIPVAAAECGAAWHRLRAAAHAAVEPARAGAG